ncbi:MAG: glycoside hydrolase family 3 N-terminal domain-containing protein [Almyronema sp.]|uniref:beta-N-acetylhexosaminidase n=1 Tax=Almyronema epifaneia S1 TaxID=2991925 RepID=A0ABW6IBB1_9CYAN
MENAAVNPVLPSFEQLTLAEQVAQLVVIRTSGHLFDHEIEYPAWEADAATLRYCLQELGVGGVILLGGSAAEVGLRSQQLQAWASLPLLIAADIEEGIGQRFSGGTWFVPPMALGAIAQQDLPQALAYAEAMGAAIAQEALAIGLNWLLAPVVDVNNNPANPVINVRAFGAESQVVSQLSTAFIRGAQRHSVLTTAKHFPGHGDTAQDSHLALPTLAHTFERLCAVELPPFEAAIAAGVDAVMTAHLKLPALDAQYPATLSPALLSGLLRRDLGFSGLVVTDALIMGGITQQYGPYEAAVLAIEAGADILLMPADAEGVIQALCEAVQTGRLSHSRIQASLERLWRAKLKVAAAYQPSPPSKHAWEHIPPPPVRLEHLGQPSVRQLASEISQASLVASSTRLVPTQPLQNLILVDDWLNCRFLQRPAPAIALPAQLGCSQQILDTQNSGSVAVATPLPTLLQIFIRGNPFRGSAEIAQLAHTWFTALLQAQQLRGLVVYGSPYAFKSFLPQLADIPYCFSYGQMETAQAIALKTLFSPAAFKREGWDQRFTD